MERELLLLGLLRHSAMHGYQLHEFIQQNMTSCVDLKKPTAYFLLDKMAKTGWITETETHEGNRPPRRVYQLTAAGEEVFQRLLRENLMTYDPARFAGDIGLTFLDALPPREAHRLLALRRGAMATEYEIVRALPPHPGTSQLVIEHRLRHLEAELAWLDEIMARLAQETEDDTNL